jgi:hypothetical protein
MAIPDNARTNFNTLARAAGDGNLALMECLDAVTREPRYVLCAVGRADNGDYVMTPFGHLRTAIPMTLTCRLIRTIQRALSRTAKTEAQHDDGGGDLRRGSPQSFLGTLAISC